jgi:hypothetical protein
MIGFGRDCAGWEEGLNAAEIAGLMFVSLKGRSCSAGAGGQDSGSLRDSEFSEGEGEPRGGMFVANRHGSADFPDTSEHVARDIETAGRIT